jgi:hypothetical protein
MVMVDSFDTLKVYTILFADLDHSYNSASLSLGSPKSSIVEPVGGCCDSDSSSLGSPKSSTTLDLGGRCVDGICSRDEDAGVSLLPSRCLGPRLGG